MKTASILTAAAMLIGTGTAAAESPSKATAKNQPTTIVAKATRAAQAPAVVVKKVDPLEAALAQAMAHSNVTPTPVKKPADTVTLSSLRQNTKSAAALKLNRRGHNRLLPTNETVVRLSTQPLDMKEVRSVVKARTDEIHYCHESLAARGRVTNGAVTVRFVIEPRGNVSTVEVAAGKGGAELERCIAKSIGRWTFPAADAPTEVDYPFVFDMPGSALASK